MWDIERYILSFKPLLLQIFGTRWNKMFMPVCCIKWLNLLSKYNCIYNIHWYMSWVLSYTLVKWTHLFDQQSTVSLWAWTMAGISWWCFCSWWLVCPRIWVWHRPSPREHTWRPSWSFWHTTCSGEPWQPLAPRPPQRSASAGDGWRDESPSPPPSLAVLLASFVWNWMFLSSWEAGDKLDTVQYPGFDWEQNRCFWRTGLC